MGKKNRGAAKAAVGGSADDDALLEDAMARAEAEKTAAAAAAAAAELHVRPLEVPELVSRLNTVPCFKVFDLTTGDILPTPDKGGGACLCWYLDETDAQVARAILCAKDPTLEGRAAIGTTPLGTALAMSERWGEGLPDQPMRLQASNAVLRSCKGDLDPLPEALARALNSRTSALPVFVLEELQSAAISPIFFRRGDVLACWEASGRAPSAMPQTMTMVDLRVLAFRVLGSAADWRSLTFVAPQSSVAACNAQAQCPTVKAVEAAMARTELEKARQRGDEPPPLEAF